MAIVRLGTRVSYQVSWRCCSFSALSAPVAAATPPAHQRQPLRRTWAQRSSRKTAAGRLRKPGTRHTVGFEAVAWLAARSGSVHIQLIVLGDESAVPGVQNQMESPERRASSTAGCTRRRSRGSVARGLPGMETPAARGISWRAAACGRRLKTGGSPPAPHRTHVPGSGAVGSRQGLLKNPGEYFRSARGMSWGCRDRAAQGE